MPLTWSAPADPNADSSYTHVIAETPLGRIILEWKGWKDHGDSPGAQMPWGDYVQGFDLSAAKEAVQAAWDSTISLCLNLCTK